jgi:tetratricopeptide (TPR) repeat protein
MPKVFISYSHDSEEHRQRVLSLSDQLREDGIECFIDQYINGAPPMGWQRWMEKQVEQADFVLVVCTNIYLRRFKGEDREGGRGVNFEGVIISQTLYDAFQVNTKFIPLIPDDGRLDNVPMILKNGSTYKIGVEYESLYRVLTDQPRAEAKPLGKKKHYPTVNGGHTATPATIHIDRLPTTKGGFFGREAELQLLNDAWNGTQTRIIQFIAAGGTGKTKLLRHWLDQTRPENLIAWSFYSQGASEDKQTSATEFFTRALELLDPGKTVTDFANQPEKLGEHLADKLTQWRCLLVLDGLEPQQHASPVLRGELKDRGLRTLLKSLAIRRSGLCVITTRIKVHELSGHAAPGVISLDLHNLAPRDGVALLSSLGVHADKAAPASKKEEKDLLASLGIPPAQYQMYLAVTEYGCHALALGLLGNVLRLRYGGDVQQRDKLRDLLKPDSNTDSHHAFKVMQAYEEWFAGQPELALLHLLGLFDHPIGKEVLQVLWAADIPHLTAGIDEDNWLAAIDALREEHHLLSARDDGNTLDCHPLIHEWFGKQLQTQHSESWRHAHKRLYDYYKALPKKQLPDTLEEMQPLFSAVAHGCAAGLHQQALEEVYWPRIKRGKDHYLTKQLGAFHDDLAALAHFFTVLWQVPTADFHDHHKAIVLRLAGFRLRALGRLREALDPMQASVDVCANQQKWKNAAVNASNLSELHLTLGDVTEACCSGQRSVGYAEQSGDIYQRMARRTTHADALHQAGEADAALTQFQNAEQLQQEHQMEYPRLYGLAGFRYCDVLLAQGGVAEVLERANYALQIVLNGSRNLLDIALNRLTLGRAYLVGVREVGDQPLENGTDLDRDSLLQRAAQCLDQAVAGLRSAGQQDYLPRGLLARAALHRITGDFARARQDLQEVFDISESSGMRLFLTDWHLEMARVLLAERTAQTDSLFPGPSPRGGGEGVVEHVEAAAKLIEETGYKRRLPEVAALRSEIAANGAGHA